MPENCRLRLHKLPGCCPQPLLRPRTVPPALSPALPRQVRQRSSPARFRISRITRSPWMETSFAVNFSPRSPAKTSTSPWPDISAPRSEEHTSELQSLRHLVCRLLLEKKNTTRCTH